MEQHDNFEDVVMVALRIADAQRLPIPASEVHAALLPHVQARTTVATVELVLRASNSFAERGDNLFTASIDVPDDSDSDLEYRDTASGARLEKLLDDHPPLPASQQSVALARLNAVRVASAAASKSRTPAIFLDQVVGEGLAPLQFALGISIAGIQRLSRGLDLVPQTPGLDPSVANARSLVLGSMFAYDLIFELGLSGLDSEERSLRDKLVLHNSRLVARIARIYARGTWLSYGDLFQEGIVGLIRALESFNPYLGYRFSTYATWWIRQGVTRSQHDAGRMIRLPVHLGDSLGRLARMDARLSQSLGRQPTNEERAAEFSEVHGVAVTASRIAEFDDLRREPAWLSTVGQVDPEEGPLGAEDVLPDPDGSGHEEVDWRLLQSRLSTILDDLRPRESEVLRLRFGLDGSPPRTLEEVGRGMNLTRERIRQVEAKALDRMRYPDRIKFLQGYLDDSLPGDRHIDMDPAVSKGAGNAASKETTEAALDAMFALLDSVTDKADPAAD